MRAGRASAKGSELGEREGDWKGEMHFTYRVVECSTMGVNCSQQQCSFSDEAAVTFIV